MPGKVFRPLLSNQFRLNLGGKEAGGIFRAVGEFSSSLPRVKESHMGEQRREAQEFAVGQPDHGTLRIERQLDKDKTLWDWFETVVINGEQEGNEVEATLELLDSKLQPKATYTFTEVWPCSYEIGEFSTQGTSWATEIVELSYTYGERQQ
jgi:phage tail-like protein